MISIITISLNSEKTIERTMRSVLGQSFRDIEYIIVDGNSTDNTHNIIDELLYENENNALLSFAKKHKININTIKGGWETNLKVRPCKDWENKTGRSVSFKIKE